MSVIDSLLPSHPPLPPPAAGPFAERVATLASWVEQRTRLGLLTPDRRRIGLATPWITLQSGDGGLQEGFNFLSADALGLGSHAAVKQAAQTAIGRFGAHSAGTAAQPTAVLELAEELAAGLRPLVHLRHLFLQPSGWSAAYGAVRAIARRGDVVLLDAHAEGGLREGALASTPHVHRFRHLDLDHLRRWLQRYRAREARRSVVVATPSVFPGDGSVTDLFGLQNLCREFGAVLVVDVAHDLGCSGPHGTGEPGLQAMEGRIDVVVGSLAKTFASNGGFIAAQCEATAAYLRRCSPLQALSSTLGPAQLGAANAALAIVRSLEGAARRAALHRAILALRAGLAHHRLSLSGSPGRIVSIEVEHEVVARVATRLCAERNIFLEYAEPPVASAHGARLRLHVMAGHEPALLPEVAAQIADALISARRECAQQHLIAAAKK